MTGFIDLAMETMNAGKTGNKLELVIRLHVVRAGASRSCLDATPAERC